MKKIALFITVMILGTATLMAQNEQSAENANGPEITFKKDTHDYGDIYVGGDGTCEFVFTNTGNEPLILSQPRSSCGCTVPTWPRQPILPGESDKISVTYNTARPGQINKTVTVLSNAKKNSSVVLRIKGNVLVKPAEAILEKNTDAGSVPANKNK